VAAGPDEVRVAADGVRAADQIEDRVDATWVSRTQRAVHVDGLVIVDLLGAQAAGLVGVAADSRDDVHAAGQRHLHRVAAHPAGRAHHHQVLARFEVQQLHRPERRDRRGGQGSGLIVADAIGDAGQWLGLRARHDRGVLGISAVHARHAEDAVPGVQVVLSRRNPLDDTREVDAQHVGIGRAGGQPREVVVIQRVDPRVRHTQQKGVACVRDGQVVQCRSLPGAPYRERTHKLTPDCQLVPGEPVRTAARPAGRR
jgi:hypothetical protein